MCSISVKYLTDRYKYINLHRKNWFVQCVLVVQSSSVYPGINLFMSNSMCVSRKNKGRLSYMCTLSIPPVVIWVRVAHFLLWLNMNYFGHFMFFVECYFLFWSLSLYYIILISAINLVPLITISVNIWYIRFWRTVPNTYCQYLPTKVIDDS